MSKLVLKIVDGLVYFLKRSSLDKKMIGGLYETIQVTAPLVSTAVSSIEKMTTERAVTERECTRQKERTNRASIEADVEKNRIELATKEMNLKLAALPLIERELEARRTAENFQRVQETYAQRRSDLHAALNSLSVNSKEDGKS